jgi:Ca-activated chloride channel family protein
MKSLLHPFYLLVLFLFCIFFDVNSQLQFDKTSFDFGELYAHNTRYVDFYVKNNSNKTEYILTIEKPNEINYQLSGSSVAPDSSIAIRLQINPTKKGFFNLKIPVYLSDQNEPIILRLKGNIKELPQQQGNSLTACPSFNQEPGDGNPLEFKLRIVTIDNETKELIPETSVVLIQNGQPIGKWHTDKNGNIIKKVPIGLSYFFAKHKDYEPSELGAYINSQRNYIIIPMTRKNTIEFEEKEDLVNEEIIIEETTKKQDSTLLRDKLRDLLTSNSHETNEKDADTTISSLLKDLDKDNFDDELFEAVNVVFVIDVSSSMNQADRLELMKFSLLELVDMLRPQDKIALVSYATNANVLLSSISGGEKDEIKPQVSGLKASGLTAGGEGIKLGYKQARRNFLKDGKNHIIIITDGGFNKASGNYKKVIAKNLKKGVTLSVVGIKNNEKAEENMKEAAEIGGGNYIPINNLYQAKENLRQEIRKITFKGK